MADHIDKQVRDAAATLLAQLITTGPNVFKSQTHPLQDADLPALRVYVDNSDIENISFGGPSRRQRRSISLVVEFCGKSVVNYDDVADVSKKEIELAIAGDNTLGGTVKYIHLRRIETLRDGEGERVVSVTRLTFEAEAYTAMNAPDVPL